MSSLSGVFAALRRQNKRQYALLFGCLFFSVLLITAYCLMMRSPTVLRALPEGGDSRKQTVMVFVLAVIGCGAFTLYASGLFFRQKSREVGIFLALGASKQTLAKQLWREVSELSLTACALGMALGVPLAWLVWGLFRLTLVDTEEMELFFNFRAYGIALAFSVFVISALLMLLSRFLKRTNILDIITESHRAEQIRAVPRWYGAAGIILLLTGFVLGYFTPSFCVLVLHWYAPEWLTALAYVPALIGLYLLLLHTVVNGWRRGKSRYAHLISTGMMQFQGRQTVRNMLVVTVLVAGAYFSAFYIPLLATSAQYGFADRTEDYAFRYRADQSMITKAEVERLASKHEVSVRDYVKQPMSVLAVDGEESVERPGKLGTTYTYEYREKLYSNRFLSERAWNALTGDNLDLLPGTVTAVFNSFGDDMGRIEKNISLVTNMVTGQQLSVTSVEPALKSDLLFGCRVLDDADYEAITTGLSDEWREWQVFFNVEKDDYAFAKQLFYKIVDCSGPEVELCDGYDLVARQRALEKGEPYFFDPENAERLNAPVIDYDQLDNSTFRQSWMYMPQFRVLDQADFTTNMAVFLLLFVFVSLLCFAAVGVILFTRSMTLILTNAWVYSDLRKLGASNQYLRETARGQVTRVFLAPIVTGTLMILAFITLILLFNSGFAQMTAYEMAGFRNCLIETAAISAVFYGLYRLTLRCTWKQLRIGKGA